MARRHKSKKFAFPGAVMTEADRIVLSKPLKEYKNELASAKALLKDKSRLRKRGKINTQVDKCTVPEIGVLTGGLRYDRKLKKRISKD